MIQSILDFIYYRRRDLLFSIIYLSMRLYGLEITFEEVKQGKYSNSDDSKQYLNVENTDNLDYLLTATKESFEESKRRLDKIMEKSKSLITICSLMIPLIAILFSNWLDCKNLFIKAGMALSIFTLFLTILLIIHLSEIKPRMQPIIDQNMAVSDENKFKKERIKDFHQSTYNNEKRTDYIADVYKTASLFFMVSLVIIMSLFVFLII